MRALSIVMPVLNEAQGIDAQLDALRPLCDRGAELLVVDGGSTDDTARRVQARGVRLIAAPRGRARQMNAGAAASQGRYLLFLHADTRLPPDADRLVEQALSGAAVWGRFDVRISGRHPMLRVIATMMNWRSRWSGIATGDQALFVRRSAFDAVGGFADQPLMEDIDLSRRLRAVTPPACRRERVLTSGRRWESRGVWRTMVLMWCLRWAYWRGESPQRLAERYR